MVKELQCLKKNGGCGQKFSMRGRRGAYPLLCPGCKSNRKANPKPRAKRKKKPQAAA